MVVNIIKTEGVQQRQLLIGSVILIVVAIALLCVFGSQLVRGNGPSIDQKLELDKHPIPAWVVQDALQCKGDLSRLSPDEQRKVQSAYPGQSAWIIISAAYSRNR